MFNSPEDNFFWGGDQNLNQLRDYYDDAPLGVISIPFANTWYSLPVYNKVLPQWQ